jgi:hypothetical protein
MDALNLQEENRRLREALTAVKLMPLQSKLDEDLPDEKVEAYEIGYEDCLFDVVTIIDKALEVK